MVAIANAESEEIEKLENETKEAQTREGLRETLASEGSFPSRAKKWELN